MSWEIGVTTIPILSGRKLRLKKKVASLSTSYKLFSLGNKAIKWLSYKARTPTSSAWRWSGRRPGVEGEVEPMPENLSGARPPCWCGVFCSMWPSRVQLVSVESFPPGCRGKNRQALQSHWIREVQHGSNTLRWLKSSSFTPSSFLFWSSKPVRIGDIFPSPSCHRNSTGWLEWPRKTSQGQASRVVPVTFYFPSTRVWEHLHGYQIIFKVSFIYHLL